MDSSDVALVADVAVAADEDAPDSMAAPDSAPDEPTADADSVDVTTASDGTDALPDIGALPDIDGSTADGGDPDPDTGSATETNPACQTAVDCPASACQDATCVGGTCVATAKPDGVACPSTAPCATSGTCQQGQCKPIGTKPCTDDNPCTTDACDPVSGACVLDLAPGAPCDDGNPCTKADMCGPLGTCAPGSNACTGCTDQNGCAQYDDGNACNGSLFCNLAKSPAVCEVLATSVVVCDTSADSACAHATCTPPTGQCEMAPAAGGAPCDDGNPCTQEACAGGLCAPKVNLCQCQQDADCSPFDDGNACNGKLYCDKGSVPYACKVNPGTVVECGKSSDPCLTTTCDATTGQCGPAAAPANTPCDDGNTKTLGDVCVAGACQPGIDTSVCKTMADCAKWEDGDLCNGTKFCNLASGQCQDNPATVVSCPSVDDTACQKNQCQPKTGKCAMVEQKEGAACDDGNPCTVGEVCQQGACVASAVVCTCQQDADCAAKEDGDLCNGTLFCDKVEHACKLNAKSIVTCQTVDDTACTKRKCEAKTGLCPLVPLTDGVACDAGSTCLSDASCQKGACVASADTCTCKTNSDCATKEDGDVCNGTLYCDLVGHTCKVNPATLVTCPTALDSICQKTQCNPVSGSCEKVNVNSGAQCDADGNPCTGNDTCYLGVCKPGALVCNCQADAECAGKQGNNLCVGVMVCDAKSHECVPAKPVECESGGDGPCQSTACNPATGSCETKPRPDGVVCAVNSLCTGAQTCLAGNCVQGKPVNCDDANPCTAESCDAKVGGCLHLALDATPCNDGQACTTGDTCAQGNCVGTSVPCNDNEACTDDACDPKSGCVHLPVATIGCNDGNGCTMNEFCSGGACMGGSAPNCIDNNPCTQDACDPTTGCEHPAEATGTTCSDGNACTTGDGCSGGTCTGASLDCNDNNPCTADSCVWSSGCKHAPTTTACDDQDACTVGDTCKSGVCKAGSSLDCEDGTPCTTDGCDPAAGCTSTVADGAACSDGDVCTAGDACAGGNCTSGSVLGCDDGNPCTLDGCNAQSGCTHKPLFGACEDGNACTTSDVCMNSVCTPGVGLNCSDGNACTLDSCNAQGGCAHQANSGGCTDGNACTVGDSCLGGLCHAGAVLDCQDGNPCTTDACNGSTGCVHGAASGSCNDGNACTGGDSCNNSVCTPGASLNCDDGNPCTIDSCDAVTGCQHKPTGAACNDKNACTVGDVCKAGSCEGGAPRNCDDGNACTTDACDPASDCTSTVADGGACTDGNICTAGDSCTGGVCVGGLVPPCGDDNPCTNDSCSVQVGCEHKAAGGICDDKNACTQGDVCANAVCTPGSPLGCDDGNPCTLDGCDQQSGCTHAPTTGGVCSDGDACSTLDSCDIGNCKGHGTLQCADGTPCTQDACNSASGCQHVPIAAACDDGSVCTGGDHCAGGACLPTSSLDCVDTDPCTNDICNAAAGCAHTANTGNACNDGNVCTVADTCAKGACAGEPNGCSDGNLCTDDTCAGGTGCAHSANTTGCTDGDACTLGDACANSSCKAGVAMVCDDSNVCTAGDQCLAGNCTSGAAISCDDGNACTVDSCDAAKGCQYSDNGGATCGDNGVCGGGECACPGGFAIQGDHCPPVLGGIQLSGAVLSPAFAIGVTSYVASLPLAVTESQLTVTAPTGVAVTLSVSGGPIATLAVGQASGVALRIGANPLKLTAIHAGMSKVYDLIVTRLPTVQQAYVKANNTSSGARFGTAMALAGDTLAVGVPFDLGRGSVQLYRRSGKAWTFEAYIQASNAGNKDTFGASVAIDGDTLVVGAPAESSWPTSVLRGAPDDSWPEGGAVYVFARQNGQWQQAAILKAELGDAGDRFGEVVAVSGGTIVIGCANEDSKAPGAGVNGNPSDNSAVQSGAVYVFVDRYGTWRQQAYLKASNAEAGDLFGSAVTVSGETLLVGAPGEASKAAGVGGSQANNAAIGSGAAYVFLRSGTTWSQQSYLKASNPDADDHFGGAVAIAGDSAVVGATGEDGSGVSQLDNSRVDSGAAYVFARSGNQWIQQNYLKAGTPDAVDQFGASVAVDGGLLLVGAPGESSGAAGINADQTNNSQPSSGAGYLFARKGSTWSLSAYLKASNPDANDGFGSAVAFDGNTAAVGAPGEASNAKLVDVYGLQFYNPYPGAGAAYVFSGDACVQDQASECHDANACTADACETNQFCSHAALPAGASCGGGGATCLAGSCACGPGLLLSNGLCRPTLTALATSAGALQPSFSPGTSVFNTTTLDWYATITADAAADVSLVLSGPYSKTLTPGAASPVFNLTIPSTTTVSVLATRQGITAAQDLLLWRPRAMQNGYMKASAAYPQASFGSAVAASGNLLVVGAPWDSNCATGVNGVATSNNCVKSGAAHVFSYQNGAWVQQAYLKASNAGNSDLFGSSVAIAGNYIVVGAPGEASPGAAYPTGNTMPSAGAAYVFAYQAGAWTQEAYLKGINAGWGDQFGYSVAISAGTPPLVLVGAPLEASCSTTLLNGDMNSNACPGAGAAYLFERTAAATWTWKAYLKAVNTAPNANYGAAVSIGGTSTSYSPSSPYYAIHADYFAVGAPGEASKAIGVGTNSADASSPGAGAVYLFQRFTSDSQTPPTVVWGAQYYVKAPTSASEGDQFGVAVTYRKQGKVLLVGAPGTDLKFQAGPSPDAGIAYVYYPFSNFTYSYFTASNPGAGDQFGAAVDYCPNNSGEQFLVGAPGEDSGGRGVDGNPMHEGAADAGAAYLFQACSGTCGAYLKASNADAGDLFGSSVAFAIGWLAVGASGEDSKASGVGGDQNSNTYNGSGAVYGFDL